MTDRNPIKSSRRQRAAESLGEHLVDSYDNNSHGSQEGGATDSWSSHDITGGVYKRSDSRRTGVGGKPSSRSASSRNMDVSTKSHSSTKSDRSHRSASSRRLDAPDSKSPYKSLSKIMDRGEDDSYGGGGGDDDSRVSRNRNRREKERGAASRPPKPARESSNSAEDDKLSKILQLGNQWKTMKEQHELASQQASSRRVDLKKEIF